MALFNSMSLRGKLTLAACALAFLAASLFIVKMAGKPSYTTVMTGVDPAKTSQITAALTSAGVGYELQNGGTAVAVKKGQETQANVALATKGLNTTSTQPGFEILDKQKLGASSQQQQVAYQRGLEGEIANTIGQIDGAQGARVNLTLGEDNLFADESQPATAAVLLPTDGSGMDPASVKGIANLVASAVPNLKPANVTITDGSGAMLWPSGDGSGGTDGLPNKTAAEAKYNAMKTASLQALLDRTLGANKAQVVVNSDLNVDKIKQQQLQYGKKQNAVPLTEKTQTETLKGSGAGTGGATGASSNLPNQVAASTGGTNGNSNYNNKTTDVTNGVDKTITDTEKATGAINRLDVAVMLDKSVPLKGAQLTSLQKTLESAAGLQLKQRGDTLNITQGLSFAPAQAAAKSGPIPAAFSGILKGVGIGLGALLFLFFVTRHLRKRERGELIDEPSWLRSLEAAQPQAELMPMPTFDSAAGATDVAIATNDPRRQKLDNLIHDEPDRVAAHLRSWITEDNK